MKGVEDLGRPAMSVAVTAKHVTNAEKSARVDTEMRLKGVADEIAPPEYLSNSQKNIFNFIVEQLQNSDILGNLDVYVLSECSICIDRMQAIERKINENPDLLFDSATTSAKEKYTKVFFRCCNELCLSPQSRAKMANINLNAKEENPLLELLKDEE